MHISCAIYVQSVRDSIKEIKRLIGDVTLYRYITHYDLEKTLEAILTTHTIEEIESIYRSLKVKQRKIVLCALEDSMYVKDERLDLIFFIQSWSWRR
jgi:predicted house-cleaning noncanonical NTP pyrophosphatase (MazG superfamily)